MNYELRITSCVRSAMFAAVIAVLAQICIPMPSGVPVTLQTFAVALAGFMLGERYGLLSVGVYIALGAVGLPVFASMRGGFAVIAGATGGFIAGFLPTAFLCGLAVRFKTPAALALSVSGMICCHLTGVIWFATVTGGEILPSFLLVSAPYLVKDAISVTAAFFAARKININRSV